MPVAHLLRHRRGDRERRRHAGLLRRRPGHLLRHRRDRPAAARASSTRRDRARAPVRQRRAGRGAARARRARAGGRRPGRRRVARGREGRRARRTRPRSASSPRRTCPAWATAGRSRPTTPEVAERARVLRFHGSKDKRHHTEIGYNSRLDSMQAAVLRILLPELDGWNEARRAVAASATRAPGSASTCSCRCRPRARSTSTTSTRRSSDDADELARSLSEDGIGARGYYRTPAHRQPAMERFARRRAAGDGRARGERCSPCRWARSSSPRRSTPWSPPAPAACARERSAADRGRRTRLLGPEPRPQLRRAPGRGARLALRRLARAGRAPAAALPLGTGRLLRRAAR